MTSSPQLQFTTKLLNKNIAFRFSDLKSPSTSLLPSERNTRLMSNSMPGSTIANFDDHENNTLSLLESLKINSLQSRGSTIFNNSTLL